MSDDVLRVIPTNPHWRPTTNAAIAAKDRFRQMLEAVPGDVEAICHEHVEFIDCGENLERIACPHCGLRLEHDLWSDQLDERGESRFANLVVTTPRCGRTTSLNDLVYDWHCGFPRFRLEAWNPERPPLTSSELTVLGTALGHKGRQILAHV